MRRSFAALLLMLAARVAVADDVWQPYVLRGFDGREANAELAILPVRENRCVRDSRLIRVAVVRLPATNAAKDKASPIVFLSGGPGIPATTLARVPVYLDLFAKLRDAGDVLLIDQRGSGLSLPNLACPAVELPKDFLASDAKLRDAVLERVASCAEHFREGGVDLHGYTTGEIAEDVEAVRKVAGAAKLRLLTFSYGSEVAFEILRRRPRTVERVVFASTRAPDTLLKMADPWDRQLESLGVLERVRRVVARLETPVSAGAFTVGGIGVLTILRNDLPDARAHENIAPLIDAIEAENYDALAKRVEQLHGSLSKSLNLMPFAVDCSSGWSDTRLEAARASAEKAVMRNVNLQWDPAICGAVIGESDGPQRIGTIDVPALFITGRQDVNNPVAQTDALRKAFRRSQHDVVDGAHETLPIPAVQERVLSFFMHE